MALKIHSKAPDFTLNTAGGEKFCLAKTLINKPVVLFFYPKSFTSGCTMEACDFRNDYAFFIERNIEVVGISHDAEETQKRFQEKYRLPYILLSDPKKKVSHAYEAVYPFGLLQKRITYFIDQNGVIRSVYDNLILAKNHLEQIKLAVEKMDQSALTKS
jgi:peroxiredoxin Q/BCP